METKGKLRALIICACITFVQVVSGNPAVWWSWEGQTVTYTWGASDIASGSLQGFSSGGYDLRITSSGGYTLSNFYVQVYINGNYYNYYYGTAGIYMPGGDVPMTIHFTVPNNEGCGAIGTFKIEMIGAANGSGSVMVVNPWFSGTTDICGLNSNSTCSLTTFGNLPNNGTRTWNINQSGWKINGQTPPVNVSSFSATITSPNQIGNATLSISGDYICSTMNIPLHCNTSAPSAPTTLNKYRLGSTCYYYLTTNSISTATTYEWSCVSNFQNPDVTSTNTTSSVGVDCPDLLQDTYVPIYVRTRNGCGTSSYLYRYTYFPTISNCTNRPIHDSTFSELLISNHMLGEKDVVIKRISTGMFELDLNFQFEDLQINVFSLNGKLLKTLVPTSSVVTLNLIDNPDGVYFLRIVTNNSCISLKFIKS